MAARAENDADKLRKDVEERLRCAICTNIFISPRMLPCLHTLCEACIVTLAAKQADVVGQGRLWCPLCRASFALPEGGAAGLPRNIFVADLVEVMGAKEMARRVEQGERGGKKCGVVGKARIQESPTLDLILLISFSSLSPSLSLSFFVHLPPFPMWTFMHSKADPPEEIFPPLQLGLANFYHKLL